MKAVFSGRNFFVQRIKRILALVVLIFGVSCAPQIPLTGETSSSQANPATAAPVETDQAAKVGANQAVLVEEVSPVSYNLVVDDLDTGKPVEASPVSYSLVVVDLDTGKPVESRERVEIGHQINTAVSPDRTSLAVTGKGKDCPSGCLRVYRLPDLQETARIELTFLKTNNDFVQQLVFHPGGEQIALAYTTNGKNRLILADLSQKIPAVVAEADLELAPRLVSYTSSGDQIMLIGQELSENWYEGPAISPSTSAQQLNGSSLEVVWQQELADVKDGFFGPPDHQNLEETYSYTTGMAADPAAGRVYIAHSDSDRLTTVDFVQRSVETVQVQPKTSGLMRAVEFVLTLGATPAHAKAGNMFLRSAVLSPDGQTLYVAGQRQTMVRGENDDDWQFESSPLGLQVWDVPSGSLKQKVDTQASEVRLAPGGKLVLSGSDWNDPVYHPFTELFDPDGGKITARQEDSLAVMGMRIDGQPVLLSGYTGDRNITQLAVLDEHTLEKKVEWKGGRGYAFWLELR